MIEEKSRKAMIPESHRQGNVDLATVSLLVGFAVMMVLDVALR